MSEQRAQRRQVVNGDERFRWLVTLVDGRTVWTWTATAEEAKAKIEEKRGVEVSKVEPDYDDDPW